MIIGLLKENLKLAKEDFPVYFDFCNCVPTSIDSWRGIYAEPSLGWDTPAPYSGFGRPLTVKQLLDELVKATSGEVYHGWKGGEYKYHDNHKLHIDNPGCSTDTVITYVEITGWCVILHTTREE